MYIGHTIRKSTQKENNVARNHQSYVLLDAEECNAMKIEIYRLKVVQQQLYNALIETTGKCDQ